MNEKTIIEGEVMEEYMAGIYGDISLENGLWLSDVISAFKGRTIRVTIEEIIKCNQK